MTEDLPSLDDIQVWSDMGAISVEQSAPFFQYPGTNYGAASLRISRLVLL